MYGEGMNNDTWCSECLEPICELLPKSQMPNNNKWCSVIGIASNNHRAIRCRRQSKPHKDHKGRYSEIIEWST